MIEYWNENWPITFDDVQQHATMVPSSLAIASVIAVVIILLFLRREKRLNSLIYFFPLLYSILSFAFFALLLPTSGLGMKTAIIVLMIHSEYVLLRSFITGIRGVDPQLIEVGVGMGMTSRRVFRQIQLPLALPTIFSGIQAALASTTTMVTTAATINAGGLGQLLFEGLQEQRVVPILWRTVLTMVLTLIYAGIAQLIPWILLHRWRGVLSN